MATIENYAGSDRYDTCRLIAQAAYQNGVHNSYAILATGVDFVDALAGIALAGYLRAPVILTVGTSLSSASQTALQSIQPKKVYALGGTSVLADTVLDAVRSLSYHPQVERVAGANRYTTLATVQSLAVGLDWKPTTCLVTANSWVDALSVSTYAYNHSWPILMVDPDDSPVDEPTASALSRFSEVIVLGGTGAVSDAVYNAVKEIVPKASRISGSDRVETALKCAGRLASNLSSVGFCSSDSFPDGLSSGQLMGLSGSPILLVSSSGVGSNVLTWLSQHKTEIQTLRFFGGTSAIAQSDRDAIIAAVNS